jgi:hypothetical protein
MVWTIIGRVSCSFVQNELEVLGYKQPWSVTYVNVQDKIALTYFEYPAILGKPAILGLFNMVHILVRDLILVSALLLF